jgi:hypothetical protein
MFEPVVATAAAHGVPASGVKVIEPLGTESPVALSVIEDGSDTVAVKVVGVLSAGAGGVAAKVKTVLATVWVNEGVDAGGAKLLSPA